MSILSRFVPAAAIALLLLTSCAQISVTGPCEVESDSSITLDIAWVMEGGSGAGAVAPGMQSAAMASVMTKLNGIPSGRPFRVRADAAADTIALMMEVPSTWSETGVFATVDGAPAMLVGLDDAPYCGDTVGTARPGYIRRFYQITPAAPPLTADSSGTLQVTYATATIADGVYHPAVMFIVEPDTEVPCFPQASFHRVTAGNLRFVNFDISSSFNADTVVNGTDVEQDALAIAPGEETTSRLAFATEAFVGALIGLPDNGLLTPERFALQAEGMELTELPECLPAVQLGWSEASDGNNSWVQQEEGEALVVDVPDAQYAELLLYVTPGLGDLDGGAVGPEDFIRAMRVEMTYEDGPGTEVATLVPLLGLPYVLPPMAADAPDLVPSFTMGVGMLTDTDGSGATGEASPLGIAAMLVTPDSSRRLVSVTITPFAPDTSGVPVSAKTPQSQAALEPVKLAVYGAAGMQLVPDLAVAKSLVTPAPYVIGNEVTYQVAVTNAGNAPATAVTVTDTIEPQLAFVSATPSAGTCSEAGGVVTCSLGDMAPGASATIDIVTNIVAVGPFSNTAAATFDGEDYDASDNEATIAAVALGIPNLAVVKTVLTPGVYVIGGDISYRIAVANDGTADSTAVTVTDALPAGLLFVSAVPSAGTCGEAAGTVTCSLGVIATGASATVDIVATIDTVGPITNTGSASMEGGEADLSDNTASVTIGAEGIANLAVGKTVQTAGPYVLGGEITYRLTVTNDGTADSTAVTVSDALPAGLTFVSSSPSAGTCAEAGGTVTCAVGVLAAGATATVDIVATLNSVGPITNTGSASMDGGEADLSDNAASVTIAVDGVANLAFGKSVETPAPYIVGNQVTYRLTVANDGTADSSAVTVTDVLPAGVAFLGVAPSVGTCSEAGGTVTCNLGVIAAGATETVDIVVTIAAAGSITNTASASMEGGEADLSDNSGSVTFTAEAAAIAAVPTLSEWAMLLLASLLGLIAVVRSRS